MLEFKRTTSENNDFRDLVVLLDADLRIRDGADHAFYAQYNKIDLIKNVVVAYFDKVPVGCGAFKQFNQDTVEVKRMFVLPEYRGKSIAFNLLLELEKWAKELLFQNLVLETGKMQPEAINLYLKASFKIIPNYGQYIGVENSICMSKELK